MLSSYECWVKVEGTSALYRTLLSVYMQLEKPGLVHLQVSGSSNLKNIELVVEAVENDSKINLPIAVRTEKITNLPTMKPRLLPTTWTTATKAL